MAAKLLKHLSERSKILPMRCLGHRKAYSWGSIDNHCQVLYPVIRTLNPGEYAQVAEALEAAVRAHCFCIDRPQTPLVQLSGGGAAIAPAPVLILFSGGVDSTLIAALAHQALPQG